jgi:hypothetical protein
MVIYENKSNPGNKIMPGEDYEEKYENGVVLLRQWPPEKNREPNGKPYDEENS